ncbi:helix-turn-helix domain-containing protein [Aquimonas sp.]|jgi:AraC-like DNA-binding protein|uniref:helix-turn-helix domain-containing protein n=1 Tax=Aquimonas sp. TaxID=1872588 RepID=UPI0037BE85EA
MNFWIFIYSIGAAQGLLLGLALWRQGPRERLLAGWMLLIALDLGVRAWAMLDPGAHGFRALRVVALFPFLHASLFYLYVRSRVQARSLRWEDLRHGLGFVLGLLLTVDLLIMPTDTFLQTLQAMRLGAHGGRELLISLALFGFSLSYVAAAVAMVLRYRRQLRATRSDGDPEALRWLLWVAAWQCLIWATALAQWLLPVPWLPYQLIYVAVAGFVLAVGYRSLLVPAEIAALAAPEAAVGPDGAAAQDAAPAPEASADLETDAAAEDPRFDEVARRLLQLFEHEHLYRQPALSIAQAAKRSGYPEYLVSAVINRRFGQPFWDWVNAYRVREAQARLLDPGEQRTALDIAFEVGFTSKSTFNAAFKRLLGETPSQCRARAPTVSSAAAGTPRPPAD